jgi:uncharacterized SAM-binding protein YcdF (DUF218 family)
VRAPSTASYWSAKGPDFPELTFTQLEKWGFLLFFVASKIFWIFLSPIAILLIAALLGVLWSKGRFARTGGTIALAAIGVLIVAAMTPLGLILVSPLEDRFRQPPPDLPPPHGIIMLAGALNERVVETAILAKRYPQAKIVFSGGSGLLFDSEPTEAPKAWGLLIDLGVDPKRITLEVKSRNTVENARFTAAIVHPEPSEPWLIVTSAFHMPRAVGLFRKAGFDAVAYPAGYFTPVRWGLDPVRNLGVFQAAVHEWIGLLAYWGLGRIDHFFPGPGRDHG